MTTRESILDQAVRNVTTPEMRRTILLWAETTPESALSNAVLGHISDIRWEFARLWESRRSGSLVADITRQLFPGTSR